jgi:hypothetical protein
MFLEYLAWDDPVQLVLDYVEIPYDKVWDEEVMRGKQEYDWMHLHHEDFAGQYGKFSQRLVLHHGTSTMNNEDMAKLGYQKYRSKLAVVKKFRNLFPNRIFIYNVFRTTTPDIALATQNTDICV